MLVVALLMIAVLSANAVIFCDGRWPYGRIDPIKNGLAKRMVCVVLPFPSGVLLHWFADVCGQ